MIKIGLILFPGSNCERETALAVKRAGMEAVEFLWNEPLEKLAQLDGYILIGGFSYEDRSRAGIIAALDPVMQAIKTQSEQGKPVLGICNGAQILLEAGLVPGIDNHEPIALAENKRIVEDKIIGTGFYNAWVHIRLSKNHQHNAFTRHLSSKDCMHLPIAHAEGRFLIADNLLKEMQEKGLDCFQYCDDKGQMSQHFPINPNGSVGNIAALSNQAGNVLAIMPHPERTTHGDPLFSSMRDYISENHQYKRSLTAKQAKTEKPQVFEQKPSSFVCIVKLIISDNQALTVEKTLRRLGLPVKVQRYEHWEIETSSADSLEKLKKSGLLYSERKEKEVPLKDFSKNFAPSFLIRPKEDLKGQQLMQTLLAHYDISHIQHIHHGVLWQFQSDETDIATLIDPILLTQIIGNPYANTCYFYP